MFGELSGVEYTEIQEGINVLRTLQNKDGGWGNYLNEQSSIDNTAKCISALFACEENKNISLRLALEAISKISENEQNLRLELDKIKHEFNFELERQVGEVVRERDDLRKKNTEFKERVSTANEKIQKKR